MKKTLTVTTLALLAGGVAAYAQGTVSMVDYGGAGIAIYGAQATGNNTTVSWGGHTGSELIGSNGSSYTANTGSVVTFTGSALGTGYDIELLAGPSTDTLVSQLAETGVIINTWDGPGNYAGQWVSGVNAAVSTVAAGGNASVAIAAWNNEGGTVTSLAQAQATPNDAWGISNLGTATALGGGTFQPPSPVGLESFSLATTVPEPSTIALGVMGASALLFRRKK